MKKKATLLLALLGILAACGGGANQGPTSISSVNRPTSNETTSSRPTSAPTSAPSSISSIINSTSEVTSEVTSSVVLDDYVKKETLEQINELAANVDKTPHFEEKQNVNTRRLKSRVNPTLKEIDVTDPANDPDIIEGFDYLSSNMAVLQNSNQYIDVVKNLKDNTCSVVRMLNTWVSLNEGDGNHRMRLSYDQVLDALYIEQLQIGEGKTYYSIKSDYNEKGLINISSFETTIRDNAVFERCLEYVENESLKVVNVTYVDGLLENIALTYSDLTYTEPIVTCLESARLNQGDRYSFDVRKSVFQSSSEDSNGLAICYGYQIAELQEGNPLNPDETSDESLKEHYDNIAYNNSEYLYIKNKADLASIMIQHSIGTATSYNISMYDLKGYDKITKEGNLYKVYVGDNIYQNKADGMYGPDDYIETDTSDYYSTAHVSDSYSGASLYVSIVEKEGCSKTKSAALQEVLSSMGLSFKEDSVAENVKSIDNLSTSLSNYKFYGVSADTILLPSEIEKIYYQYRNPIIASKEEVEALAKEEYVFYNNQKDDESYFALCSNGVEGSFAFDYETNTFDLSNITITLPQSNLFNRGEEYSLVAKLTDGVNVFDLDSNYVTYEGVETSISLNSNVALPSGLYDGKYNVLVYLTPKNDVFSRMSNLYYPVTSNLDVLYKTNYNGVDKLFRVKANEEEFTLAIQDDFTGMNLITLSDNEEGNSIITFETTKIDLFNDYVLDESMIISFTGYLYNDEEEILISNKSFNHGLGEFNINGDVLDVTSLEYKSYNIKFVFEIIKDDVAIYSKTIDSFYMNSEVYEVILEDRVITLSIDSESKEETLIVAEKKNSEENPDEEDNENIEEKPKDPTTGEGSKEENGDEGFEEGDQVIGGDEPNEDLTGGNDQEEPPLPEE